MNKVTIINDSDLSFAEIGRILDIADVIKEKYGNTFINESMYLEYDLGMEIGFRLTVTEDDVWTFENNLS